MLVNDVVRTLLAVCGQVAIGESIEGQTVMPVDHGAVESQHGETRKTTHIWTPLGC